MAQMRGISTSTLQVDSLTIPNAKCADSNADRKSDHNATTCFIMCKSELTAVMSDDPSGHFISNITGMAKRTAALAKITGGVNTASIVHPRYPIELAHVRMPLLLCFKQSPEDVHATPPEIC